MPIEDSAPRPGVVTRRGPPPALDARRHAVFLDIDGTLLDIAPTPERVILDPALAALLPALSARLSGALALVTGRSIRDTDRLFRDLRLPVAGQHGCERRDADGGLHLHAPKSATLARLKVLLADFASRHAGLRLEDKGSTLAVHYRGAPQLASHVHQTMRAQIDMAEAEGFELQPGKRLVEVRPGSRDKGTAIRDFMLEPPFRGRVPVFVGDDVTDEHGFAVVRSQKGIAIKVGPGTTRANHRLPDVAGVRAWLEAPLHP
ncbi:MAG: trehalose-phosphatase [Proteobacteria bacterium]|nr:trehalose-phosphatase [Pseudomonadota bacterium]